MLITSDINESWLNFKKTLLALEKKHSWVIFRKQPKTLPFLTKEVKKLINQKSRAWKRYVKKRNQETLSFYKAVRNRVADSVKKLKSAYEENLASEIKLNPKSFWRHVF